MDNHCLYLSDLGSFSQLVGRFFPMRATNFHRHFPGGNPVERRGSYPQKGGYIKKVLYFKKLHY